MVAKQEVERTKEGRTLTMIHSSFSSALNALHPGIDWNASSPFTEKQFHLRLLDNIKHKLAITQVLSQCFYSLPLPPPPAVPLFLLSIHILTSGMFTGLGLVFRQQQEIHDSSWRIHTPFALWFPVQHVEILVSFHPMARIQILEHTRGRRG